MVSGSTDCRDRKSAERWLLQFRSKLALENINLKETKIPTFGDCYDLWTKGRAPRLAETSLKMYRCHWRRVWSPWKDVKLTELQHHIDALYTAYKTEVLKQAAAMMGLIGFSHHRLRASLATHLLNKRVPPTQVQAILRHESIHTTVAHYIQQDLKTLRTAMEAHHISTRPTDPDTFPKNIPFAC